MKEEKMIYYFWLGCLCGVIIYLICFIGHYIKIEPRRVICIEKQVAAAYIIQNGGSPYYEVSYQDGTSERQWDYVPFVGQKIKRCN